MSTDDRNEQSPSETKQTRQGVATDDKSKGFGAGAAPHSQADATAVRQKSGVASDDKSKGFDA